MRGCDLGDKSFNDSKVRIIGRYRESISGMLVCSTQMHANTERQITLSAAAPVISCGGGAQAF